MSALDHDSLAERIADRGRDELVARFRRAYEQAVGAHADLVSVSSEQVDAMVSSSVAEADGLQWRRALAGVAARELGIELGPALTHPAVARAHELVGAPSYEGALAQLAVPAPVPEPPPAPVTAPRPAPPAPAPSAAAAPPVPPAPEAEPAPALPPQPVVEPDAPVAPAPVEAEPVEAAHAEAAPVEADTGDEPHETVAGEVIEPSPLDEATQVHESVPPPSGAPEPRDAEPVEDDLLVHRADEFAAEFMSGTGRSDAEPSEEPSGLRDDLTFEHEAVPAPVPVPAIDREEVEFEAVHIGGVASLPTSETIVVRLAEAGLDLIQIDGTIVGRLGWSDISALEVTVPHGRRRRREPARLIVHTEGGSARFEVPEVSGEDLREQVEPLMTRFGR